MSEEFDITADFVTESKENLNAAEEDFLTLAKLGKKVDVEVVNRAFRCVHSIKGGAGFLGLTKIMNLSHAMEALMDLIRKEKIIPDKASTSFLLESVDLLNTMFDQIENLDKIDIGTIQNKLLNLVESSQNEKPSVMKGSKTSPGKSSKKDVVKKEKSMPEKKVAFASSASINLRILNECLSELLNNNIEAGMMWAGHAIESLQVLKESARHLGYSTIVSVSQMIETLIGLLRSKSIELQTNVLEFITESSNLLMKATKEPGMDQTESLDVLNQMFVQIVTQTVSKERDEKIVEKQEQAKPKQKKKAPLQPVVEIESTKSNREHHKKDADVTLVVVPDSLKSTTKVKPLKKTESIKKPDKVTKSTSQSTETIRVKVSLLNRLMSLAGEMVLVRNQQLQILEDPDKVLQRSSIQKLDIVTSELQECVMKTRMQPIGSLLPKYNRIVYDLGRKLGKEIELTTSGGTVELDKSILEALSDPLTHMIRNSCDHGLESSEERSNSGKPAVGRVHIGAWHEGGQIRIEVKDDGGGIDPEIIGKKVLKKGLKTLEELNVMSRQEVLELILLPGFSTVESVSEVSGRGVGMDVVRSNIEKIGGTLKLSSIVHEGTSIELQLPLTLAIIPSLIIVVQGSKFAIPQVNLEELVTLYNNDVIDKVEYANGREIYRLRNKLLPLVRAQEILDRNSVFSPADHREISNKYKRVQEEAYQKFAQEKKDSEWNDKKFRRSLTFAVLKAGNLRYGLIVDEVLGNEEIVVKSMHPYLKNLECYSGATVMGDGKVALILDVYGLAKHGDIQIDISEKAGERKGSTRTTDAFQGILLFQYGKKEQFAIPLNQVSRIERIQKDQIEHIGDQEFITVDGISTRVVRMDQFLEISSFDEEGDTYLLLPKSSRKPFGILISKIEDSVECTIELDMDSYVKPGIIGTSIILDRMTLFIDIFRLSELSDPEWGENHKQTYSSGKKVLMVEDVAFFQALIKGFLESIGFEVVIAENGQQALEFFQEEKFDLIISDIEMPVMNGIEFIQNVRGVLNNTTIPAIAVTSLDSESDRIHALEAGFNAYEVKIEKDRLLKTIQEFI